MSYADKDAKKAKHATQFIGRGTPGSSTEKYRLQWGDKANTGKYTENDIVFISVNGNRPGRVLPDLVLIEKAARAGALLITDSPYHRNRSYNIGEREVAAHLQKLGCKEIASPSASVWNLPQHG